MREAGAKIIVDADRLSVVGITEVFARLPAILDGLDRALDPGFRTSLRGMQNPYGSGHAADTIIDVLKRVELDDRLLVKRFHDLRDGRADGDG